MPPASEAAIDAAALAERLRALPVVIHDVRVRAGRFVLPALAALHHAGRLPVGFGVVGAATAEWDDEVFARAPAIDEHGEALRRQFEARAGTEHLTG